MLVMTLADKNADGTVVTDDMGVKLKRDALATAREAVIRSSPKANAKALGDHAAARYLRWGAPSFACGGRSRPTRLPARAAPQNEDAAHELILRCAFIKDLR